MLLLYLYVNMFIIITVEIGQFVNTKGDSLHRLQE